LRLQPLTASHRVEGFDCGVVALDQYLKQQALRDMQADKAQTMVAVQRGRVLAYFSLAAASIEPGDASPRAVRGQGSQPIPAILLARFAVDRAQQGRGLGRAMLVEALARSAQAADTIGARVVLVHAKGAEVRGFYERFGFEPSPTGGLQLMLLMKDIRTSLGLRKPE
jgi:GNAT superfamily N-acetyltransferase